MKTPKIFIIILNWNGMQDTLACLESVQNIDYENFFSIVVDNGSTDDSVSSIREKSESVYVIETHENLGFAAGNNVGIEHAIANGAEYIFLLNNDTVVDSQILHSFVDLSKKQKVSTILGGRTYLFDQPTTFDHFGGNWNPKKGQFDLVAHRIEDSPDFDLPISLDYVCGCALFAPAEIFKEVGGLDPRFFLYFEESDFCSRAKACGFPSLSCPKAKLWHKVSASMPVEKSYVTYFFWRNRLLWMQKNLSWKSSSSIFIWKIFPEIIHLLKLNAIKTTELFLLTTFFRKKDFSTKKEKLLRYRAALRGIIDFFTKRFGNAPLTIWKLNK
ncbi:MAG: glycosyltransferase family 2 protein [Simkaniaceae bacterium]|nr:glycosyltransferase family 2 protein [Simkaniaceae bacterium]